jgi:hypothetical protein
MGETNDAMERPTRGELSKPASRSLAALSSGLAWRLLNEQRRIGTVLERRSGTEDYGPV